MSRGRQADVLNPDHGDECVLRYGGPVIPPAGLFTEVSADVLVPGTRPGMIGARTAAALPPDVRAAVEATISGLIRQALDHEDGPLAGACERTGAFLRGWWGEPPAPPLAPAQ